MKVKTSELTGAALDYAVAMCEGTLGKKPERCFDCAHFEERCGADGPLYYCSKAYWDLMEYGWNTAISPDYGVWDNCPINEKTSENYSSSWEQGGPIIEREKINLHFCCDLRDINGKYIHASINTNLYHGYCKRHDTPLIAAMRCYVASKMGEEIEIPEELCQGYESTKKS